MFPIRCDHRKNFLLFSIQCRADAVKHLLYYPVYSFGSEVLLLCEKHFDQHIRYADMAVQQAKRDGHSLVLSSIVRDAGRM